MADPENSIFSNYYFHCYRCIYILFFLSFSMQISAQEALLQQLDNHWIVSNPKNNSDYPAQIPSEVHRVLFENKVISDPFFGNNEVDLQWIGQQEWVFSCNFTPDKKLFACDQIELQFPGLDTYCDIYLNDSLIQKTNNAFRSWNIPVKDLLKSENNILEIRFFPIDSIQETAAKQYPFTFPESRCFSRKPAYQSGWDWSPVYKTMGITKPVKLLGWHTAVLRNLTVKQTSLDRNRAGINFVAEIESAEKQLVTVMISDDSSKIKQHQIELLDGHNRIEIPYTLLNPRLWWPNGLGEHNLYHFEVSIVKQNEILDKKAVVTGFRTVELINEPDSIGRSFYFKVNGKPVFMKGTNYIPQDNFVTNITPDRIRKLVTDAAKVNMNMIRVWGGGVYPDDFFYEVCDSLGLLVWQDFMFAGTMYPFDNEFIANVEAEARGQIQRIGSHPSLALWCGNNEVSEAFHNWGWQKSLHWNATDSANIWKGYLKLFEEILPELVMELDSGRIYWPSSPSVGWGRKESLLQGDCHYWGVWWGEESFFKYEEKVGRFMSEYGFQSMPEMSTIAKFTNPEELRIDNVLLQSHQKHQRGKYLIDKYMEEEFPVPADIGDYLFVSQLVQASGMVRAIETHRRAMPYCMGTLYWQLNDSWPSISWSSVDYYGKWKALHYKLKDAFAPVFISFDTSQNNPAIFVINDAPVPLQARLVVKLQTFEGETIELFISDLIVPSSPEKIVLDLPITFLASRKNLTDYFIHAELLVNENIIARKQHYFIPSKYLHLSNEQPEIQWINRNDFIEISVTAKSLIKDFMLQSNDSEGFFEENFTDLLPGTTRRFIFRPSGDISFSELLFESKSMNGIVNNIKSE